VAGAAIDVYRQEPPSESPLVTHEKIIVTPHLGASTTEAQERVAVDAADQMLMVLRGEPATYTVNAPLISPETMAVLRPFLDVAERTASLATQLSQGQLNSIELQYLGEIANHDVTPLKAAAIKGLLAPVSEENVSIVNANLVAEHRGLQITERTGPSEDYPSLISVRLETEGGETTVAGTAFHDGTHIEQINEFRVDIPPNGGNLLICENQDRPGAVGAVGSLLGQHDINISFMRVGREQVRGRALMVLGLDDEMSPELLQDLDAVPNVHSARLAKI
jgi:D-3-phosphoglycerate dehydrogenase